MEVNAVFSLKVGEHPIHDSFVKVVAAESGVACGSENFKYAVCNLEDGYVESTAAEVVNHNLLVNVLIHAVSKCCGGRLVDDTENLEACYLACVLGSLTLCVGEVCRNCDNCLCNGGAEVCFRISLELLQYHSTDLLRGVILAVDRVLFVGAHLTLYGYDGSFGIGDSLTFCNLANHSFARFGKRNYGRSSSAAFCICYNDRLAAFVNCHARVSRAEVYTDNFCHNKFPPNIVNNLFCKIS